jgi:hypothetical protein
MQARINGNSFMLVQQPTINNPGSGNSLIGTKIQYFNGSTDYIECYGTIGTGQALVPSSATTYFQAAMIRSA